MERDRILPALLAPILLAACGAPPPANDDDDDGDDIDLTDAMGGDDEGCGGVPYIDGGFTLDGEPLSIQELDFWGAWSDRACYPTVDVDLVFATDCGMDLTGGTPHGDETSLESMQVWNEEACGLPRGSWDWGDMGGSRTTMDGRIFETSETRACLDGTVVVDLGVLLVDSHSDATAQLEGSATLTGRFPLVRENVPCPEPPR